MAEITDPEEVRIGYWYYMCCEEDLTQILTSSDLEDVKSAMQDRSGPLPLLPIVFRTRDEAIEHLGMVGLLDSEH